MPNFIGSSAIIGNYGTGGPTGPTGNTGSIGNIGLSGITKGNTGATGNWIANIVSNLDLNQIRFTRNDGINYTFTGFTGNTGTWSAIDGVSAVFGATFVGPFKNSTGITFNFFGISAGTNTTVSLENNKVVVRFTSPSGSYDVIGATGYIPYIEPNGITVQATKIYADSNNQLNYGLTGTPVGNPLITPLFTDFTQGISFISPNSPSPSGGYNLDLSKQSVFWLEGPIGITSFINGSTLANVRQEYTFFINVGNGTGVWNLPKNLYFSGGETAGIKYSGFLEGINVLFVWSDNGGITYNASILNRGIGNPGPFNIADWGSCCKNSTCFDNMNLDQCNAISGSFRALTHCFDRNGQPDCGVNNLTSLVASATEEGICCCGVTGCIDSTNAPMMADGTTRKQITRAFCNSINGTFKKSFGGEVRCSAGDIGTGWTSRTSNSGDYLVCPSNCLSQNCCCSQDASGNYTSSNETPWYCDTILGGYNITGRSAAEVESLGGCNYFLQTGYCRRNNSCFAAQRIDCMGCGSFYTNETDCLNAGQSSDTALIDIAPGALVNIVHSVGETDSDFIISYNVLGTADSVEIQIQSAPTNRRYTLDGYLRILDEGITTGPKEINLWDLVSGEYSEIGPCLKLTIKDQLGNILTPTNTVAGGSILKLTFEVANDACFELYGDQDFTSKLVLYPVSCTDGPLSSGSNSGSVDVTFTRSPCRCLAFGQNGYGVTGDVVNAFPVTIPWSATRYCTHCTTAKIAVDGEGADSNILHVPYPLKTQTGFITFCPQTLRDLDGNADQVCELPEFWCTRYGRINELSGCTYSSLFDSNGDRLSYPPKSSGETNLAPTGCYHIEYNEINILDNPAQGTTYWFSGTWNYLDVYNNAIGDPAFPNPHIRPCPTSCRNKLAPTACQVKLSEMENPSACGSDSVAEPSGCCTTCAGVPLFVAHETDPARVCFEWFCQDYQPYFNTVLFDTNVLSHIAKTYDIDVAMLNLYLQQRLQVYSELRWEDSGPPVALGARQSNLFNPLFQNRSEIQGRSISGVDPDDLAKASCDNCPERFNKDSVLQVDWNGILTDFQNTDNDVYGMVISREKTCVETDGVYSGKGNGGTDSCEFAPEMCTDGVGPGQATQGGAIGYGSCPPQQTTNIDYKYFIVLVSTKDGSSCLNVFEIGSATELIKIGSTQYDVGCGGGSIFCGTDCGNGAILNEFTWLGTLPKDPTQYLNGFCSSSKKVSYNIKKKLEGIYRPGTALHSISDIIEFTGNTIPVVNPALESSKKQIAGNLLKNIFGKERSADYEDIICLSCTRDEEIVQKQCGVNVIPQLLEFIGADCYMAGFDSGASDPFGDVTFNYNNTRQEITLTKSGSAYPVCWLPDSDFENSPYSERDGYRLLSDEDNTDGTKGTLITSEKYYLENYFNDYDSDTQKRGKYQVIDPRSDGTPHVDPQNCVLRQNFLDNRFLLKHNLSYLEISNDVIVKRKRIFSTPNTGVTLFAKEYSGTCTAWDGPRFGLVHISDLNIFNQERWNPSWPSFIPECSAGFDDSFKTSYGSGCSIITTQYVWPKFDWEHMRPAPKILVSALQLPDRSIQNDTYKLGIKFNSFANPESRYYIKFLWHNKREGTIVDITNRLWGAWKGFSPSDLKEARRIPITDWDNDFTGIYTTAQGGYLYHYKEIDLYNHLQQTLFSWNPAWGIGEYPELLNDLTNPENPDVPSDKTVLTGIATQAEQGNIYILLRESKTRNSLNPLFEQEYKVAKAKGILPRPEYSWGNQELITCLQTDMQCDSNGQIALSLGDYALSRITNTGIVWSGARLVGNIKKKELSGMCISIDCTNDPDACKDLRDC